MARQNPKKDVVIVGLGWTGAIMGMELCEEGLEVIALERGPDRDTVPDFRYPDVADELRFGVRFEFMQRPRQSTMTIRHNTRQVALPHRRWGSFLLGNGVGGSGIHWNGVHWRPLVEELRLRSYVEETFGADIIPEGMQLQDWGVSYEELEPYLDRFEKVAGIAGIAGNLNGEIMEGGNPFEAPRANPFPMPPLPTTLSNRMFADAVRGLGHHPFVQAAANASQAYVNPYGMQLGPCNFCGFCERYGCLNYSKSSPQTCILDALKRKPNFQYRTGAEVLRVDLASDRRTATGVTYFDEATQEEVFQPADIVILAAYQIHNVHLMLVSGIGQPYDPATGEGVTGRNYSYQMMGGASLQFADIDFNPFVGAGANGIAIDDFAINQIDFGAEGFIGGGYFNNSQTNGQPIRSLALPEGSPTWGADWKRGAREWYGHSMGITSHASNMAYRDTYLDLDPTYTDRHGRPLLRMTFDWKPNDIAMAQFMLRQVEPMVEALNPTHSSTSFKEEGDSYDTTSYQTTHNVGGAVMGNDPATSAVNRYLQSWDVHNVFVQGAGSFPQNLQYNPTGMVGGLTYWSAHAILRDYLPNPRPLV